WFDPYRGVMCLVRVVEGRLRLKQMIRFGHNAEQHFEVQEIGTQAPRPTPLAQLTAGEVGFFAASVKEVKDARVGDTVVDAGARDVELLPGFREVKPMVFA